jgi:citrate lyase beta subunit
MPISTDRYPKSPRRSLLFTPGDSRRKIEKVTDLAADVVVLDLEDAVAVSAKDEARQIVCEALQNLSFNGRERMVRLNAPGTSFFVRDLEAIAAVFPDGLVIPKAAAAADLARIDEALTAVERQHGQPVGSIRLLALVETAAGILNAGEIAGATGRLDALIFGGEDFVTDIGAVRTGPGLEILYARSAVVVAAAAFDLQVIDTVFPDTRDADGLRQDAEFARGLGYTGKIAIHPAQIAAINEVFSPTADEIAAAARLLSVATQLRDAGAGVFMVDGKMVDAPLIKSAEQLLDRARLCGLLHD